MGPVIEIGYFQLENLQLNGIPFVFLDLRKQTSPVQDEPLKTIMSSSVPLSEGEVSNYLNEKLPSKDVPVVLLCEDGSRSTQLALDLESDGYINVHIIEGGFKNLSEESSAVTHS